MMTAAALAIASCSQSTSTPSWFDWRMSSRELERLGALLEHLADVGQGLGAVNARLAGAEQVEVRTVQYEYEVSHLRVAMDLPICALSMTLDGSLSVKVNGEHRRVAGGISIADMLNELGLDPLRVAVERNLEIVPRGDARRGAGRGRRRL